MESDIIVRANEIKRRKKAIRVITIILLLLLLLLTIFYFVFGIIYSTGNFSITLDKNLYYEKDTIIYNDPSYKIYRSELYADTLESFDNITEKWLPDDLDDYYGSHNGENYIAYTFYTENIGTDINDYWSEVIIDDSIKNVDAAVRIRIYKNGEYVTYAKLGSNGFPETGTTSFESDTVVVTDHVENFSPGDINRYTVVIWLEGKDPDCNDNILGGEIKIHMEFNSEKIEY